MEDAKGLTYEVKNEDGATRITLINGNQKKNPVKGAFSSFIETVLFVAMLLIAGCVVESLMPRDSTDLPGERSGVKPTVDALTGCHYLRTLFGGITPRMGADGRHICTGPEGEE